MLVDAILVAVSGIPAAHPAAAREDGQALFEKNRQRCNGPDGRGHAKTGEKMKVPVWDETKWDDEMKLERAQGIENVRTNKKHKTVSRKVGDAELDAIASYVATLLEAR